MLKSLMKSGLFFIISQFLIIITEYFLYRNFSVLHYINISFYIFSLFLISGLFIFVIKAGFFDLPAKAFTMLSLRNEEKVDEIRPLSKLIIFNYKLLFFYGFLTGAGMLIALFFYYN